MLFQFSSVISVVIDLDRKSVQSSIVQSFLYRIVVICLVENVMIEQRGCGGGSRNEVVFLMNKKKKNERRIWV